MAASTLLVTGVNGDIGRLVVAEALAKGKKVFATVRNEAHFSTFAEHQNLHMLLMHVDQEESVKAAFNQLDELLAGQPLDAVIHCAAISNPTTVEFLDHDLLLRTFKINTEGSLSVTQQSLPRLRKSGGNLVIAGSLWSRISGPLIGSYAMSKWGVEALIDAARRETVGMGFNIVLANIGAVQSKMLDRHAEGLFKLLEDANDEEKSLYSKAYKSHAEQTVKYNKFASKAGNVAKRLIEIADKPNPAPHYKIGTDLKVLTFLNWLLPARWMDKLLGV